MPVLRLKPGREDSVLRGHPWVFSGALQDAPGDYPEGTWVALSDGSGHILAHGYICHGSIALRLVWFGPENPGAEGAIRERLRHALALRRALGFRTEAHAAFRLLNGEGDGIPGLVIDWYHDVAVVQLHVRALRALEPLIREVLRHLPEVSPRVVLVRDAWAADKQSSSASDDQDNIPTVRIREHDLWYDVQPGQGQKTGFYLDQRANRLLCRHLARDKRVLNLFSYTGGFTLNALAGGAGSVVSVDISASALESLKHHLAINHFKAASHQAVEADVFRWIATHDDRYDLVISDPPSLARSLQARHTAIQAYKRLHEHVLRRVKPGGLLMTFSCTSVVLPEHFEGAIRSASIAVGSRVKVLRELGADADHPWALVHPEGRYLKGFLLSVE